MKLSPKQAEKLGEFVVELLSLKFNDTGRIDTSGGDKTELGLGKTLERAFKEISENAE